MKKRWKDLEAERLALPKPISRAEMARRAGLAEATITKGLQFDRVPYPQTRRQVELILDAERQLQGVAK